LGLVFGASARAAVASGLALNLAGGPVAFSLLRLPEGEIVPVGAVPAPYREALARLTAPPPAWAGLPADVQAAGPQVMGILNVTPDSLSDGGKYPDAAAAIAAGLAMVRAGAALVDVGGESTRPGAATVSPAEERARVLPVVAGLAAEGVAVSVDTRNAATMAAALGAGARVINDVSGLTHDPESVGVVAGAGCPVVVMHMRGTPADMNRRAVYGDVLGEVAAELGSLRDAAVEGGVALSAIALDPGIGFAKSGAQNLVLLPRLAALLGLGQRLVVGVSRKTFIGRLGGGPSAAVPPEARDPGSLAAGLFATLLGASVLRTHDVSGTVQAIRVWEGLGVWRGLGTVE
jgi:dihydropteroate synthase